MWAAFWHRNASGTRARATSAPSRPIGGRYAISTDTSVPRSPGASTKRTRPEFGTRAPGSDRHATTSPGTSSVSSASQDTDVPPGAVAVQRDRPPSVVRPH